MREKIQSQRVSDVLWDLQSGLASECYFISPVWTKKAHDRVLVPVDKVVREAQAISQIRKRVEL